MCNSDRSRGYIGSSCYIGSMCSILNSCYMWCRSRSNIWSWWYIGSRLRSKPFPGRKSICNRDGEGLDRLHLIWVGIKKDRSYMSRVDIGWIRSIARV